MDLSIVMLHSVKGLL